MAIPVSAVEYGGIGGRPAYPRQDNSRTEDIFIHTLEPGSTKDEGVVVVNNSSEKKTILVYSADSTPSSGGGFACKQFVEEKKDVGAWISLSKTEVTLEPKTNEIIPFVISVPGNASVGEHNGCILMQEKKDTTDTPGMNLSLRTGLRVAITIPGEIKRSLEIVGFAITKRDDGSFLLKPQVKNNGNVSIDTTVNLSTSYFFGPLLMTHGGDYPVLRGETSEWNFELKKPFWGGLFKTSVAIAYDSSNSAGIGVKTDNPSKIIDGDSKWFFSFPTFPALIIELIILVLIIVLVALIVLYFKRKKWINTTWVDYIVCENEDIMKIAEKHNVSWRLLAKVNSIRPPFTVLSGTKIKVPPHS